MLVLLLAFALLALLVGVFTAAKVFLFVALVLFIAGIVTGTGRNSRF